MGPNIQKTCDNMKSDRCQVVPGLGSCLPEGVLSQRDSLGADKDPPSPGIWFRRAGAKTQMCAKDVKRPGGFRVFAAIS